jgi:hypothetical protein
MPPGGGEGESRFVAAGKRIDWRLTSSSSPRRFACETFDGLQISEKKGTVINFLMSQNPPGGTLNLPKMPHQNLQKFSEVRAQTAN